MAEKAVIEILEGDSSPKKITVMFNPESYNISYGASYSEKKIPGLDGPISQYISGESMTLDMTLFFDTYEPPTPDKAEGGSSVAEKTKLISGLVSIDGTLHHPPAVRFQWGKIKFKGYVISVKESYTMFLSDGTPVRARVEITFKSLFDPSKEKRKSPFESPDRTKVRILHEKEQLWNYAYKEYGDAGKWREIAAANGIANPLMTEPGMELKLPAL